MVPYGGIATTGRTSRSIRRVLEEGTELLLVVVEDEERACILGPADHPGEVALLARPSKDRALYDDVDGTSRLALASSIAGGLLVWFMDSAAARAHRERSG
jgi:hypothetical protein